MPPPYPSSTPHGMHRNTSPACPLTSSLPGRAAFSPLLSCLLRQCRPFLSRDASRNILPPAQRVCQTPPLLPLPRLLLPPRLLPASLRTPDRIPASLRTYRGRPALHRSSVPAPVPGRYPLPGLSPARPPAKQAAHPVRSRTP